MLASVVIMDLSHPSFNNDVDNCNFYLPSFGFSWCHFERIANLSKTGAVGFRGHFKGFANRNRTGRGVQSWNCIQSSKKSLHFQLNSARNVFDLLIIRANPPDYDTDLVCQDGSGKFRELSAKKLQSLPSVLTDRSK